MKTLTLTSMLSLLLVFSFNYANAYDQTFSVFNNSGQDTSVSVIYTKGHANIMNNPQNLVCTPENNTFTCNLPSGQTLNVGLTENSGGFFTGHVNIGEIENNQNEGNSWYYQSMTGMDEQMVYLDFSPYDNRNGYPFTTAIDDDPTQGQNPTIPNEIVINNLH